MRAVISYIYSFSIASIAIFLAGIFSCATKEDKRSSYDSTDSVNDGSGKLPEKNPIKNAQEVSHFDYSDIFPVTVLPKRVHKLFVISEDTVEIHTIQKTSTDTVSHPVRLNGKLIGEFDGTPASVEMRDKLMLFSSTKNEKTSLYQISLHAKTLVSLAVYPQRVDVVGFLSNSWFFINPSSPEILEADFKSRILTRTAIPLSDDYEYINSFRLHNDMVLLELGIWSGGFSNIQYFVFDKAEHKLVDVSLEMEKARSARNEVSHVATVRGENAFVVFDNPGIGGKPSMTIIDPIKNKAVTGAASFQKFKVIGQSRIGDVLQHEFVVISQNEDAQTMINVPSSAHFMRCILDLQAERDIDGKEIQNLQATEARMLEGLILYHYGFEIIGKENVAEYANFFSIPTKQNLEMLGANAERDLHMIRKQMAH